MEISEIEIKKELISYYDTIKSEIDIKALEILKYLRKVNNTNNQEDSEIEEKIIKKNEKLIKQVEKVFDLNLEQVNRYFKEFDVLYHNEKIKRIALKDYIIYVKPDELNDKLKNSDTKLGLLLQFEWYIDESQINFIK